MKTDKPGQSVRKPVAAGLFYPAEPLVLKAQITKLLEGPSRLDSRRIAAMVVPHAGYSYSGLTAALAYREIRQSPFARVVVISPSHRDFFHGVSVYPGDWYESPLGRIEVDREFCETLARECRVARISSQGHAAPSGASFGEHALEVQLPFLQGALENFRLVPLVMGDQELSTCAALGLSLSRLCRDAKTLIVASSDLSHFHSYEKARVMDLRLLDSLQRMDYFSLGNLLETGEVEACGGGPVIAAMIASENLGAEGCELIDYRNSGDVEAGMRDRVVGYASAVMMKIDGEPEEDSIAMISDEDRRFLLDMARVSVETAVRGDENPLLKREVPTRLKKKAEVFVTLTEKGGLRGCIGSIIPQDMLYRAVAVSAVNAALHDPRFNPVEESELPLLSYEVSVLSRFRLLTGIDEIEIGRHGLLIQSGYSRGLLLPQVAAEHSWDRNTFLEETCQKASLPRHAWKEPETDIFVFSAAVFNDRTST